MTDKVTAWVGTRFSLQWTADPKAKIKNTFEIVKDPPVKGEHDVTSHEWEAPRTKKDTKPRPEVEIKLSVTWGGEPYAFRRDVKAPKALQDGMGTKVTFTQMFTARDEGDYVFTVTLPNGSSFTKEVTVEPAPPISEKRQLMLDTIARWMPSSTLAQNEPKPKDDAEKAQWIEDIKSRCNWSENRVPGLMELSGWWNDPTRQKDGKPNPRWVKDQRGTSCGDVLSKMLSLWGADFDNAGKIHPFTKKPQGSSRAFGIRDDLKEEKPPGSGKWVLVTGSRAQKGAISYGYYQDAGEAYEHDPPTLPEPGDVLVLRNGLTTQDLGHVNIIVSASTDVWRTADGGGGAKINNEQTATVGDRVVKYTAPDDKHPKGRPIVVSVTDGGEKLVDGWVVLDRIPNIHFNPDGTRKDAAAAQPAAATP